MTWDRKASGREDSKFKVGLSTSPCGHCMLGMLKMQYGGQLERARERVGAGEVEGAACMGGAGQGRTWAFLVRWEPFGDF